MTVGSQLRGTRTERRLSLSDVTKATKIQPWVLEALEADRLPELMSPVYVKGFLSTYARFLNLAPETLIAQLRWPQPAAAQEALPAAAPQAAQPFSLPPLPSLATLRRLGMTAAAVAAVLALVVWHPVHHRRTPKPSARKAPISAPVAQAPAPTPAAAPASAVRLASVAPVTELTTTPELPTLALLPTQPLELSLVARRTTWIQVRADGKLLTQERLPRGAKERWTAKKRFDVVIADPAQVDLTLNGQSIGPFAVAHQGRVLITHHGVTRLPDDGE